LEELGGLERLHDLLGKMLSEGVFLLIRRGIDCGYRDVCENTASVRGKILVSDTVKQALRVKGQVACNFEEMTHDVLHNQILRSTLKSLLQLSDLNPEVRTIVRNAYKKLNGVTCLPLKRQLFQRVSLDRNRQYYRFLLSICGMINEQLFVQENSGKAKFKDIDEAKMGKLYEDFIIEFYRREQNHYQVNRNGRGVNWMDSGTLECHRSKLPRMEADVILESANRRIIMDAKFYKESLGGRNGGKLHSENLYQLLAYLRNREATVVSGAKHEGILLYPTVEQPLNVDVCLEGFMIRARSINLNQNWQRIHNDMLSVIE